MIAGPSEITIVGDRYSNPEWIAADLIGQAEHDTDSQCILSSKNIKLISRVKKHIIDQLNSLPSPFQLFRKFLDFLPNPLKFF